MKKFNAVNKRNGKAFVVTMLEDKAITREVGTEKEKEVSLLTIKRWFELGEEILPEVKKEVEKKEIKKLVKKDGTVRTDNFRPRLTEDDVRDIKKRLAAGEKQAHLAKEYGVSNQTIRCIRFGWMWKHVS